MFATKLAMNSTLIERYLLYRHPVRIRTNDEIADHDALIEVATPSVKRNFRLNLERKVYSKPDGLAAILVDDTLFAGTRKFRRGESKMHDALKMDESSNLCDGLLEFGGLEVKAKEHYLVCHQRQYLSQNVSSACPPSFTEIRKTIVKK